MTILKKVKKAVEQPLDEEDEDEDEEEQDEDEEDEDDDKELGYPPKDEPKKELRFDRKKEEPVNKPNGFMEIALLPLPNGTMQPGWNVWSDGKKFFTSDELLANMASKLFKAIQ